MGGHDTVWPGRSAEALAVEHDKVRAHSVGLKVAGLTGDCGLDIKRDDCGGDRGQIGHRTLLILCVGCWIVWGLDTLARNRARATDHAGEWL
eukprot:684712-Prymnesium_polylepis.1